MWERSVPEAIRIQRPPENNALTAINTTTKRPDAKILSDAAFARPKDTTKGAATRRMRSARHAEDLTHPMIMGAEHTEGSWEKWQVLF